jgi:hypothetical protein
VSQLIESAKLRKDELTLFDRIVDAVAKKLWSRLPIA